MLWPFLLHGSFLWLAFVFLTPLSLWIALFGPRRRKTRTKQEWIDLHLRVQLVSHTLALVGTVAPFFFLIPHDQMIHLRSPHTWLGLVLLVGVLFVQPMLGTPDESDEPSERRKSLRLHSLWGKVFYVLSVLTVLSGLLTLQQKFTTALDDFLSPLSQSLIFISTAALFVLQLAVWTLTPPKKKAS